MVFRGEILKTLKTAAASVGISLLLFCIGCGVVAIPQSEVSPSISKVLPGTVAAGSQGVTMTVVGTNFSSDAVVLWNGNTLSTSVVNGSTLAAPVPGSSLAAPAVVQLMVQDRKSGNRSNPVNVTITSDSGSGSGSNSGPTVLPLSVVTSSLSAGSVGAAYSAGLSAAGGTLPYTWSIASGQLPAGITLDASNGELAGTPTASGTFSFTVTVKDAESQAQTATANIKMTVSANSGSNPTSGSGSGTTSSTGPATPVTLLTASRASLPVGTVSKVYGTAVTANGGTTPYLWTLTAGQLPPGVSMATNGAVSGTPAAAGTYSFTATVTDSGSPAQTASVTDSITISGSSTQSSTSVLGITTSSLPAATEGQSYGATLQASGGTGPYTWSISSGSLPAGLSMSSSGAISGTPAASGASATAFTVAVTDSSHPAQSATLQAAIQVLGPAQLAITTSWLAPGTSNTAYSMQLLASGGTPAYTWSIATGSLPAGLTLGASTGIISGTPTATGTSNFTVAVSDNSTPAETSSMAETITVSVAQATGPGTTWYIRPDGGTRYDARVPAGQCDGKADAPYPGSGVDQHCAFGDYRYLWDDQSYGGYQNWAIAGGDTVIVRGGPWRVGFSQGTSPNDVWCVGGNGPYGCINPPIPAGTASQPTRILGENYGSCSKSNMTQIFGGFGVAVALNLKGAQYVDVECLEITRHSQCVTHGTPAYPGGCSTTYPLDDYDSDGIQTDVNTHDVLLQDIWDHGHTDRGVIGPIGGAVTCLRCDIAYNGMAGWDFDDGSGSHNGYGTASVNGVWNFEYSTIEWNGCDQEYPTRDAIPVISCYSQSTGGYGDGVGTPPGTCLTVNISHSAFNYNTQDGLDLGHVDTGACSATIMDSEAIGNNGQTFKWGPNENPVVFENNLALANCLRMSVPMPGAPSTYNANLSDFCRAGDNMSFNFRQGGTALLANNTIIGYQPTSYDINCWDASCSTSVLTFENNITMGYDNPSTYSFGGQAGGVGGLYFEARIGTVTRLNNLWYGMRPTSFSCPTGYPGEKCEDPLFVNEPAWTGETGLDNFNFSLTSGSPAYGAGLYLPSLLTDYTGAQRGNPPSIGAYEQ